MLRDHIKGVAALFRLLKEGRLKDLDELAARGKISGIFQIDRFDESGKLYDHGKPFHNIFVNVGLAEVWNLVTAQGGTAFSNANARLGVGNSAVAPAVGQTDLQGGSTLRKAMNVGFPNAPVNGLEQWQSDFTAAEANFAWEEFAVFNAAAAGTMMNRSISSQGTKTAGQTWRLTYSFTLS